MPENHWTNSVPTTSGYYWFHGYDRAEEFIEPTDTKRTLLLAYDSRLDLFFKDGSDMFYDPDGFTGVWQKVNQPSPPA